MKKHVQKKALAAAVAAAMAISLCPQTALAATGSQVAANGTYTESARVVNNPEDENDWVEYNVEVSLEVKDGKFSAITVTPDKNYDEEQNKSYFSKAVSKSKGIQTLLVGQAATENTINEWDTVSGATCTSKAVKAAALAAIQSAPAKTDEPDDPDEPVDPDKPGEEEKDPEEAAKVEYVLMNIPYAEFYQAEVRNNEKVDAFTSATLSKTRTGSLAGGSYHENSDGSKIDGITFPVKVSEGVDLSGYTQITDDSCVDITVTNRGTTTTTTYSGKEALFESATYSYYVLSEAPAFYKEATANADGSLTFGKTVGEAATLTGVTAELSTESSYGDYQMSLDGLTDTIGTSDKVYAVIISTSEGSDYGLRHLENIWRVSELAWCTGFTDQVHNCPTSSAHYVAMMGQHINQVTYYTEKGIYKIPVDNVYVPVKFDNHVEVADASITAGSTNVTVEGLPTDYDAQYSVEGLTMQVSDGVMTFSDAKKGKYTLVISDKNGKYADLSADFILYTEEMPAAYNENSNAPALVKAQDASDEDFADYLENITSVSVNGVSYSAAGRNAVVIVNEDGTIKTDAAPFAEGETFQITISATGYKDYTFTYAKTADPVVEVNTASLEKAIEEAEALKEADYTPATWSALQATLAEAKAALEAMESQDAVDKAAAALNSAIAALEKNTSIEPGETNSETNGGTTGGTNNNTSGSNKTTNNNSTAKAAKTGDFTNLAGWFALALASVGAAGVTAGRRGKSKNKR